MGNNPSSGRGISRFLSGRFGRKLIQYALVLFIALTINFALPRLAPGDPLMYFMGQEVNTLTPEQRDRMNRELGLEGSVWEQYGDFMKGAVSLQLGSSTKYGKPVTEVLRERIPWTLLLVVPAFAISPLLGIIGGAYAAWNRGKRRDVLLLAGVLALESTPGFWVGMLLIAVFAVRLGWLPSYGAVPLVHSDDFSYYIEMVRHLILPVSTITIVTVGTSFLLTRSSMLDTLGQDYIYMAEAKGVSRRTLIYRHALRNALLPVYTHVTMSLGVLLSGAVVVETVFSYPGLGRLLYESVVARDYPMMQGVFLMITIGVIAANLLADLTYPLVDPRARSRKQVKEAV
ncbi:ABC transporter permease [Paenibacillus sp. TAB 01]|uniref:ABC transporter permease n=1 Tax=Paenibacillus sp. TAB 01 TaxID=3368988 RepID=UPI003752CA17